MNICRPIPDLKTGPDERKAKLKYQYHTVQLFTVVSGIDLTNFFDQARDDFVRLHKIVLFFHTKLHASFN